MDNKKLTTKEKLFVSEYLKDFNGTQAAIRAGYNENSAKQIASENLTKLDIQIALSSKISEVFNKVDLDVEKVVAELKMIAFSDIAEIVDWESEETGREIDEETGDIKINRRNKSFRIKDKKELGKNTRLISEISESVGMMDVKRKIKLHDKMRALEMLGKYYKLFVDKVEHSNPDGSLMPQVVVYLPENGRESE